MSLFNQGNRVYPVVSFTPIFITGAGSRRLVRDRLNDRGVYTNKQQGNMKLNSLRMKLEAYSCTPMYRFTIHPQSWRFYN